jgi:hypothetical protein
VLNILHIFKYTILIVFNCDFFVKFYYDVFILYKHFNDLINMWIQILVPPPPLCIPAPTPTPWVGWALTYCEQYLCIDGWGWGLYNAFLQPTHIVWISPPPPFNGFCNWPLLQATLFNPPPPFRVRRAVKYCKQYLCIAVWGLGWGWGL